MLTSCIHLGNCEQKSRYSLWQCRLKQGESETRPVELAVSLVISWSRVRRLHRRCVWREHQPRGKAKQPYLQRWLFESLHQ